MDNTSFKFEIPQHHQSIIKVVGVGGGGSNAVGHMFEQGIKDVEFIICNTDSQHLQNSTVPNKLQIGTSITEGLGAGADPEKGRAAALESKEGIRELLSNNTKMLFITAGMGGGTGTGAAPVIAQIAKELGILTVGIVTAPFKWEGKKKMQYAGTGIDQMKESCDTVLVIMNDKLKEAYPNFGMNEAFSKADDVLTTAAKSIAEIVTKNIKVNVDFNDVSKVMKNAGTAVMGSGIMDHKEGENVALKAGELAIVSPLLNNADISGAERILLTITHGEDVSVSMEHFEELNEFIMEEVGDAVEDEMIFGFGTDSELEGKVKVTIVATGFEDKDYEQKPKFVSLDGNIKQPEPPREPQSIDPMGPVAENQPKSDIEPDNDSDTPNDISRKQVDLFSESSTTPPEETTPGSHDNTPQQDYPDEVRRNEQHRKEQIAQERREKLKGLSMDIKGPLSDEEIKEKLETPAYKRKNVSINKTPHSSEDEISRYTLNDDDEILGNNRFLHDNVD